MTFSWKNKRVLVTGGAGMIGLELVEQLEELGAVVEIADIAFDAKHDLTKYGVCKQLCIEKDYVFHLAGIKGNPRMTKERPVDFMAPMLAFDRNMIVAAQEINVKRFLYTSSIAVENFDSDLYPATAKLTAERLIEAMRIQYDDGTKYCIVRPCNIYGRYDNFKKKELMVVSDLIKKGLQNNIVEIWDDGQSERDFLNAKDCARGMIQTMKELPDKPVNLCSGIGVKIIDIANIISKILGVQVKTGQPQPPTRRVMDLNWNFKPQINIEEGIKEIIEWKLKGR